MAKENQKQIDYERIAKMESFRRLSRKKNVFLWTMTVIFMAVYMLLPVLTTYTTVLHQIAFGAVSWVWIYSFLIFVMVWGLAHFYVGKANKYDKEAKEIIEEYERGAGQ